MALTYTSFLATLASLSITGATTVAAPPQRINSADLPLAYARMPSGETQTLISRAHGVGSIVCDFIILVNPVMQSRNSANQTLAATLMDNLQTALENEVKSGELIAGWSMRMDIEDMGEVAFWAVVTTVTARDD